MKITTSRPANPADAPTYFEWLKAASSINLMEPAVYSYPCLFTLVIEQDGEPVLMNSFHPVLVMEALAPKPGIAARDEAMALRRLYQQVRHVAISTGVSEVWFTCVDESLHKYIERKGFKRIHTPIYRMVVGGESDPLNEPRPEGAKSALPGPLAEGNHG